VSKRVVLLSWPGYSERVDANNSTIKKENDVSISKTDIKESLFLAKLAQLNLRGSAARQRKQIEKLWNKCEAAASNASAIVNPEPPPE